MAVHSLWQELLPGASERVPFVVYIQSFSKTHGRLPRLAIDGYQWIFECRSFNGSNVYRLDDQVRKCLVGFKSRIRLLLQLKIEFVIVFDGPFKPIFKRNYGSLEVDDDLMGKVDHDQYYKNVMEQIRELERDKWDLPAEVVQLRKLLDNWSIPYLISPGEGEAQCAYLQTQGLVDCIVTNDVDTLIFGGTLVLRNFSKNFQDKPASNTRDIPEDEFYVTPISMDKVTHATGLDTGRLLFVASLRGGDYNHGVNDIGIKRSIHLAKCGRASPSSEEDEKENGNQNSLVDLSAKFFEIYKSPLKFDQRLKKHKEFRSFLVKYVKSHSKAIFKRKYEGDLGGFMEDFYIMLYTKPILDRVSTIEWKPVSQMLKIKIEDVYQKISDLKYFMEAYTPYLLELNSDLFRVAKEKTLFLRKSSHELEDYHELKMYMLKYNPQKVCEYLESVVEDVGIFQEAAAADSANRSLWVHEYILEGKEGSKLVQEYQKNGFQSASTTPKKKKYNNGQTLLDLPFFKKQLEKKSSALKTPDQVDYVGERSTSFAVRLHDSPHKHPPSSATSEPILNSPIRNRTSSSIIMQDDHQEEPWSVNTASVKETSIIDISTPDEAYNARGKDNAIRVDSEGPSKRTTILSRLMETQDSDNDGTESDVGESSSLIILS
ncbi:hypothetical protein LJB42_001655 [Komagataella kurtzmanii]|nr:hypothetical protein LJB42_001655 [Komagataella kurtzmanii]